MTREIGKSLGRLGIPVYLMPISSKKGSQVPRPTEQREKLGFEFDAELEAGLVKIIRVSPHVFSVNFDGINIRKALVKLLAERPVSAVLGYYHESIYLPGLLKKRNIPFGIIATWQSYERAFALPGKRHLSAYFGKLFMQKMVKRTYRQAGRLFPSSNATGRELVDLVGVQPERLMTCYLGVSGEFSALPRPKPEKINRFLYFGRFVKSKGIADAISAFKIIATRGYNDWQFDLYGEGQVDWVKAMVTASGLEQHIHIHNPVYGEHLGCVLSQSHVAILPSHYEAFGLAFAEAQASGLPVISYAAGSIPEVVAHQESGWLAPKGDIDRLAIFLIKAIENPDQTYQMGLAGRERVKALFSWDKTAGTILTGLQQIGARLP